MTADRVFIPSGIGTMGAMAPTLSKNLILAPHFLMYHVTELHKACCNNSIAIRETIELTINVTQEILQVLSVSARVKTEMKTNGNAHFI